MVSDVDACADGHAWELRDVSFDIQVGTVEDYECLTCGSFTVRQSADSRVGMPA